MGTIVHSNGGGGVSSSELSAVAANVLSGQTYIGNDTNDNFGIGTMPNISNQTVKAGAISYDDTTSSSYPNGRIIYKVPNSGYYNNYSYLWDDLYLFGMAQKSEVLNNKTFTSANSKGLSAKGTMPNNTTRTSNGNVPGIATNMTSYPTRDSKEGTNSSYYVTAKTDTNGAYRLNLCPPEGYYPGKHSYVSVPMASLGNTPAANVLEERNGVDNTFTSFAGLNIKGTMKNYSGHNIANNNFMTGTRTSSRGGYVFVRPNNNGFYDNTTEIEVPVENLFSSNIKKDVTVGGITGTFEGYIAEETEVYDNGIWRNGYNSNIIIDWLKYSDPQSSGLYTVTYNSNNIFCEAPTSVQQHGILLFTPTNLFNASRFSRLSIETSCQASSNYGTGESKNYFKISIYNPSGAKIAEHWENYSAQNQKRVVNISLASINQSVYFEVHAERTDTNYYQRDFTIYNIKFS